MFGNSPSAQVEVGSIGWEDEEDYFFPGETTNDGHTLVRVQLFRGRDFTKPISDRAQGVKLICHVLDGNFRVPTKNARCYVAIPHGMDDVQGAGVIVGTVGAGNETRRNISAGDTVIAPAGDTPGQAMTILKTDGTITDFTTDNNLAGGQSIYSRVGRGINAKTGAPDGFTWAAPWGSVKFDPTGFHVVLKESGAEFHLGALGLPAPFDTIGSYCNIVAGTFHANVSGASVGGGAVQLANAQAAQSAIAALQVQIASLVTAVGGCTGGTAALAAVNAVPATNIPAAATLVTTASALLPTTASADI